MYLAIGYFHTSSDSQMCRMQYANNFLALHTHTHSPHLFCPFSRIKRALWIYSIWGYFLPSIILILFNEGKVIKRFYIFFRQGLKLALVLVVVLYETCKTISLNEYIHVCKLTGWLEKLILNKSDGELEKTHAHTTSSSSSIHLIYSLLQWVYFLF